MIKLYGLLFIPLAIGMATAHCEPDERPEITHNGASSTLSDPHTAGRYAADKLYDGDPLTSRVEGNPDDGLNESVTAADPQKSPFGPRRVWAEKPRPLTPNLSAGVR